MLFYLQIFILTLLLAAALTFLVMGIAGKLKITDQPDRQRKFHRGNIPLLGHGDFFGIFSCAIFLPRPIAG
ncbi:MAG: hypothetical protein PHS62_03925, partial [Patescibacteria group bacterium]|nr:hypothetical protein [Patescibacteria group bacterium]